MTQHGPGLPGTCITCPLFEFFSRSCGHRDRRTVLDVVSDDGRCPYYDEIRKEAMQELESEIAEE